MREVRSHHRLIKHRRRRVKSRRSGPDTWRGNSTKNPSTSKDIVVMFTLQTSSEVTISKKATVTRIGDSQSSLVSRVENIFFVSIRKEDDT